ncbi:Na+/H+ antiporter subunit D [Paenibacillus sp. 1P07SE]|uniref:Na+/H+ antiporter subunit D n=1 Tax=Paenibacillus sp. 1P07SE TaxID=3132209 RepID=UPI0039A72A21
MSNVIMLPILLPFVTGALLILFSKRHRLQRIVASIMMIVLLILSVYIAADIYTNGMKTLAVGGWQAPFGIILAADNLAAMMVVLTSIVGLVCLFYSFATIHPERERYYFYPFFFFLLTGVNGSFLTGDLFNLFVFFEVMLLASYALMVIGGTKYQLRETMKYAIINVCSSLLFLIAVGYLYGVVGTVNMAQLAQRIGEVEQTGILQVIAILFFLVFAIKGALFPLYFWLPRSYYGPPAVVMALFGGLLTKVGVYAMIRVFTLIFNHDIGFTHHNLMLWVAGLTMLFGVLGAVAKADFKKILAYNIISHLGYMVMGLGLFTKLALAGAIFYIAHHILIKTGLLLLAGAAQKVTGTTDLNKMGGLMRTHPYMAWFFLILALSIAGIPPLSGFFGKFALITAAFQEESYLIAAVSLIVGLLTLLVVMKIFMSAFWGGQKHNEEQARRPVGKLLLPVSLLVVLTFVLGFGAQPFFAYTEMIAEELLNPEGYIQTVMKE